jgi:hypothetical protein
LRDVDRQVEERACGLPDLGRVGRSLRHR